MSKLGGRNRFPIVFHHNTPGLKTFREQETLNGTRELCLQFLAVGDHR